MGNDVKISTAGTAYSFQSLDGSNQTIVGLDKKISYGQASGSMFIGFSTNFNGKNYPVFDMKGNYNCDKNGTVSQNIRIRNNFAEKGTTTQIRYSPFTLTAQVAKDTKVYANPHYVGKYDYKTHEWTHAAGAFLGVTQNLGKNLSLSGEIQRYNLQDYKDNSGKNWSVNAIVNYKF